MRRQQETSSFDAEDSRLVISGAQVVDGTGSARFRAEVVIAEGRIAEIVAPGGAPETPAPTLDAEGLVLAPGFIDMHAHSDLELLRDGSHSAKLLQGVTTEVIGQDGLAYAPVDDQVLGEIRAQITGWNGDLPDERFRWRDVAGYLQALDEGIPVNAAFLVPQGNLRMMTVGRAARAATGPELDRMRELLADGLDAGAFGMSSGLTYTPGMHASTSELTALCRVVAEYGGFWAPHTRGYGAGALAAYREVIEIARASGCAVHLTHATMNFPSNRGRAGELLALVDDAIADGVDVTLDTYPYLPGATTLSALLPAWATEGGLEGALAALVDPDARARIRRSLEDGTSEGAHGEPVDWRLMQISSVADPALAACVGSTVADLPERAGAELGWPEDAFEAAVALLIRDRMRTGILMHVGDEQNVRAIMRHPRHMGGSDGILTGGRPHPRGWGTFPRYFREYVRERGVLELEEAVRHFSANPARRLGLTDRGAVAEGAIADLVLFDPDRIADESTFDDPRRDARGVKHVLIGGRFAVRDGAATPGRLGRALRHRAKR